MQKGKTATNRYMQAKQTAEIKKKNFTIIFISKHSNTQLANKLKNNRKEIFKENWKPIIQIRKHTWKKKKKI